MYFCFSDVIVAGKVLAVTSVLFILTAPMVIVPNRLNVYVMKIGPARSAILARNQKIHVVMTRHVEIMVNVKNYRMEQSSVFVEKASLVFIVKMVSGC